jgi:hypothetical protein
MDKMRENELLSAYLDGELTAVEQAQVEQLLAASPAARQLLDEFRALSSTLQSLPQTKVGEDLGPSVLRTAERRMLGAAVSAATPPPPDAPQPGFPWREHLRGMFSGRALVWSGLAVAIAVMMMVAERRQVPQGAGNVRQIAQAPPVAAPVPPAVAPTAAERPRELTIQAAPRRAGDANNVVAEKTVMAPAPKPINQPADHRADRRALAAKSLADRPTADKTSLPNDRDVAAPGAMKKELASGKDGAEPAAEKAKAAEKADEMRADRPAQDLAAASRPEPVAAQPAPLPAAAPATVPPPGAGVGGRQASKAAGQFYAAGERAAQDATPAIRGRGETVTENVLVVRCDLAAGSARQQAFHRLLASNGMAAAPALKAQGDQRAQNILQGSKPLEMVYVEATPAQIGHVLAQLAAQPEAFPSVSVEPASGVAWQQDFGRYSRRDGATQQASPANQAQRKGLAREAKQDQSAMREQLLQPQQSAPVYRVLFVLRRVEPERPAASTAPAKH